MFVISSTKSPKNSTLLSEFTTLHVERLSSYFERCGGAGALSCIDGAGGAGGVVVINGVIEFDAADGSDIPSALIATTVKVSATFVARP